MAFETKAGLLVGIGFIVCFAVVLSHRGRGEEAGARMAYHVLSRHGDGGATHATTIPNAFIRPSSATQALFHRTPQKARNTEPRTDPARLSDAAQRQKDEPRARRPAARSAPAGSRPDPSSRRRHLTESANTNAKKNQASNATDGWPDAVNWEALFGSEDPEPAAPDERARPEASPPSPEAARTQQKPLPQTQARRYTVAANDTLWSIARRAYGKATRQIVEAVFEANQDRLKSMNDLRPGTEIVLPHLEGVTKTTPTRAAEPPVPPRRKPPTPARDRHEGGPGRAIEIKYYNVQEGDRYATIAEKYLGDKSRWPEIHELNKDIFPDPGRIQHGVRIRIPIQEPAGRHQATP